MATQLGASGHFVLLSASLQMRLLSVFAGLACAAGLAAAQEAQAPFAAALNAEHEAAISNSAEKHGYTVSLSRGESLPGPHSVR